VHERQSDSLDPVSSLVQEKTIEAILDAGLNPLDLENTRTGVFMGACYSENDKVCYFINLIPNSYAVTGAQRSMIAHRLSYFLKLKGPSYVTDTACSSSLYAFEHAYRALRQGEIDNAIVGGGNICLHPLMTLQFARLGVLSKDGTCKTFDEEGNGYVRSEAVAVLFLQRAKNAKRIYAEVVHAKTNCDGYKEQSITFPSKERQGELLTEFYDECGVDRYSLSFLEAHGTGTSVGDPEECSAIDDVLVKRRTEPLLIGSVKSNIGHSEPTSGVCSIIKCIIGMENGFIPPNIHYNKPKPEIKGLVEGRMKVVTEKMKLKDDRGLMGVNSFGFGGGNCHVLLRWNPKTKVNNHGIAKDNLPRLVCVSGRTEEAVRSLLSTVDVNKFDTEYIKILQESFRNNVETHVFRGYTIVSRYNEFARSVKFLKYFPHDSVPLYFGFEKMNKWYDIGYDLMTLSAFSTCIQRIQNVLCKKVNILDVLLKKSNNDIDPLLGSTVVQMGLIDLFNLVEVKPTGKRGYPFAELLSAYCDGTLSLEDTINYIFSINKALNDIILDSNNNNNLENNATVDNHKINSHSYQNETTTTDYIDVSLKTKVSSSIKGHVLQSVLDRLGCSKNNENNKRTEYFVNTIFSNDTDILSKDSVLLKFGDSLSEELEDVSVIPLFNKDNDSYLAEFFKGLGSLYELGFNPQISKLYPPIPIPVSRGTEMISPYIKWNHRKPKSIPTYHIEYLKNDIKCGDRVVLINADDNKWKYIRGHVIDGRNIFPAAGYLYLVWETFSAFNNLEMSLSQVCFEHCRFIRVTTVPKQGYFKLQINIQSSNGNFQVTEGNSIVVTGRISLLTPESKNLSHNCVPIESSSGLKLKSKDVYKELRLRGYTYKGGFRAIEECDSSTSTAYIKWDDNWVTFIDNMLQLKILQSDTRLLYVPTYISKLTIMTITHLQLLDNVVRNEQNAIVLPVINDMKTGVIRSGGISIWGLIASSIPRKKLLAVPVLESYKFVPNFTHLDVNQSVRVNMQIILENNPARKVKAIELIDEFTKADIISLMSVVKLALEDQPLIQPTLKILSKTSLPEIDIDVENKKLESESDCMLVIASNIFGRNDILEKTFSVLTENAFILTRESPNFDTPKNLSHNLSVFTVHRTSNETFVLLRRRGIMKKPKYVKVNNIQDFHWLSGVQNAITKEINQDLILYSENKYKSGVLGLVNCLRREPQSQNVRCLHIMDDREVFRPQVAFYRDQLEKNMAINICKNGQWGTYRHLLLERENFVESGHCFLHSTLRGDLSSLKWREGPLHRHMKEQTEEELITVYYSALNFRDIMTATGKINVDVITQDRLQQECVQGFEFSGRDSRGRRYMGMVSCGALSTLVLADIHMKFPIPDSWSLEEAATVPVVYATVIYSLIIRGQMARGESILIHSGTGGIGQAAIRLALYYGCTVFTTIGTKEKRDFLKKTFPQLKDKHIGNSHDESFEQLVLAETKGRGVDMVLNSLAEEKLVASVRCLAKRGRFIEIGKFDLANNHHLSLLLFQKCISFQGVMLDKLFSESPRVKQELFKIMTDLIKRGTIKPLNRTVFNYSEVEQAFRFMATGKHMGKILVQIREPEKELIVPPSPSKFRGISRYFCNSEKVYLIAGGLGGFGLELADWLILRGAKRIVLTSRKGITNGYQEYRLRIWKTYGVIVKISTAPITTREGCKQLIEESLELGSIDAVFNLAVVLADGVFENQTRENFVVSFGPKAYATQYLDEFTRNMCPDLRQFVVFSSVSCGRGNAGQTNYGMSNSVMERICEQRRQAGYPAMAIEWGAVGEVGLVAELMENDTEIEISGTLQQGISNCLQLLDTLLKQKDAVIVSSMVVAEKKLLSSADNVVDAVLNILGISDSKSVSLHSTLAELGMDSMTAVEIKQTLERDFEVFLAAKDVRSITLSKLKSIQDEKIVKDTKETDDYVDTDMLFRLLGDTTCNPLTDLELESKVPQNSEAPTILLFPGIEGGPSVFQGFTKYLNAHTVGLNLNLDVSCKSIVEMAQSLVPTVQRYFPATFTLVGYSFGTVIAIEVANILESLGYNGTLICIDGSPLLMKEMSIDFGIEIEKNYETTMLCHMLSFYFSLEVIEKHKETILKCANWDERLNFTSELIKQNTLHDVDYQRIIANGIYKRSKALMTYTPTYTKLKADIALVKPSQVSSGSLPEDYGLSTYFEKPVKIHTFEGNHITILENEATAEVINSFLKKDAGDAWN
ncbi:fatty acid synthase-like, partial [Anoplophora glabripennis]|uniref:fatty acid synthase-like n=1 Tax=Anoplophora glabripennis TaxID=217634 RepID=UPI000C76B3DA